LKNTLFSKLFKNVHGSQFDKACPELVEGLTMTSLLSPWACRRVSPLTAY